MTAAEEQQLIPVAPEDLVFLDDYTTDYPLKIDLVYAQPEHPCNLFKTGIYRPDAKMQGHREFVPVILRAAEICWREHRYIFELKDCLRTVEAQERMRDTEIVRKNPHWLEEPNRLLSPPGRGGHPRGMAVDIVLLDDRGREIDMGTPFDHLSEDRANNPAARNYPHFPPAILENRRILERAMTQAAAELGREILPLPQEWWDFRFPYSYSNLFAPVYYRDLPPALRMTSA